MNTNIYYYVLYVHNRTSLPIQIFPQHFYMQWPGKSEIHILSLAAKVPFLNTNRMVVTLGTFAYHACWGQSGNWVLIQISIFPYLFFLKVESREYFI